MQIRTLSLALVATVAAAMAQPVFSADGWYFGVEAGGTAALDADNESQGDPQVMPGDPPGGIEIIPGVLVLLPTAGTPTTVTPGEDIRFESRFDDGFNVGLTAGVALPSGLRPEVGLRYRENDYETLLLQRGFGDANGEVVPADGRFTSGSLMGNLWFDFLKHRVVAPYVGVGIGVARVDIDNLGVGGQSSVDDHDTVFAYQGGAGLSFAVSELMKLSLDYRYFATDDPEFETSVNPLKTEYVTHNVGLGFKYVISPIAEADADGDGVPDRLDRCSNTPKGVPVDAKGCPVDTDGDGVPDHKDKCPNTPADLQVGADGCPLDADGDGVPDGQDQCPATPQGLLVNAQGCALDEDNDGVPTGMKIDRDANGTAGGGSTGSSGSAQSGSGGAAGAGGANAASAGGFGPGSIATRNGAPYRVIDQCPNSPPGAQVNAVGCSADEDGDGIPDSADLCPGTPMDIPVMRNGCGVNQAAVLQGVNFEFDSDVLTLNAERVLDTVAQTLLQSPGFGIAIVGHTDSLGSDSYNQALSAKRAASAKRYVVGKGVDPGRITTDGAGESQPIADNDTDAGRAKNRRIELTVTSFGG